MGYQDILATNLRMYRARLNLTQEEVADGIGVTQDALSRYEQGKRVPAFPTVVKIADYFHVSTDELVGRTTA